MAHLSEDALPSTGAPAQALAGFSRSESQLTSESERSLLNGSYSTFDGTSVGSNSPPRPSSSHLQQRRALTLPTLPAPDAANIPKDAAQLRATQSYRHATWARTFHSRPELFVRPQSTEEVQKAVLLARKCRRRLQTVGSGHSPSDLTCTSSWMMNLGSMNRVIEVQTYDDPGHAPVEPTNSPFRDPNNDRSEGFGIFSDEPSSHSPTSISADCSATSNSTHLSQPRYFGRALVQAGISLCDLNLALKDHGLTLPNLGSIHIQSLAGAIATATHGSSTHHGLLSNTVRGLRMVLASGEAVWCSTSERPDLFRAALVSLGALGVITEIEIEVTAATNIEWESTVWSLDAALKSWDADLWTSHEFVRCWWMPYTSRVVVWRADKTILPARPQAKGSAYAGWLGYHGYQLLLLAANWIPPLVPLVERVIMGLQHGFSNGAKNHGVDELRTGLLMDCLYSQFVNEWAIPLRKGPEAITRLNKWLLGQSGSNIPFDNKGLYAHAPIEVRVSNGSISSTELGGQERAFLDTTEADGPTLYLNATLYRPYGSSPPWMERYYEAFEWLMKEYNGRPHWAKNFHTVQKSDVEGMYGTGLDRWRNVRSEVDPEGLFVGDWHRRLVLGDGNLGCEELEAGRKDMWGGGVMWSGKQARSGGQDDGSAEELSALLKEKS